MPGAARAAGGAGGRTAVFDLPLQEVDVTFPLLAYCIITNAYTLLRKMSETMKKDVGMTPCQKLLKQEGTVRWIESMQQSSATPSLHLGFWGLQKIVACSQSTSQCLLSFWHGVIPTSFFILNDFIIMALQKSEDYVEF